MLTSQVAQPASTPSTNSPSQPGGSPTAGIIVGVVASCFLVVIGIVILVTVIVVIGRKIKKKRGVSTNEQVDSNDESQQTVKPLRYFRPKTSDNGLQGMNRPTNDTAPEPQLQRNEAINAASHFVHPNDPDPTLNTEEQEEEYDSDYSEVVIDLIQDTELPCKEKHLTNENASNDRNKAQNLVDIRFFSVYSEVTQYEEDDDGYVNSNECPAAVNAIFSGYKNERVDKDKTEKLGVWPVKQAPTRLCNTQNKPPPVVKKRPPVKKKPRRVKASSEDKASESSSAAACQSIIVPMSVYDEVKIEYGAPAESDHEYQNVHSDQLSSRQVHNNPHTSLTPTQVPEDQNRHYINGGAVISDPDVLYYNQREVTKDKSSYYNCRPHKNGGSHNT